MPDTKRMSRRELLQRSAAAGAALSMPGFVFAESQATLKVGLIGCGGRGTGAAEDCVKSSPGVSLVAMGDVFPDRLASSAKYLKDSIKDGFQVKESAMFSGFDAYKQVLAANVDLVILTTPPGFRPMHFAAAVDAGKHVFMEKPVAVDGPGVRAVIEASKKAKEKRLGVVAGTQRRHDLAYRDIIKRIHDGELGDVVACYAYWNQGGLWMNPRQASWTDMEWQLRNWLYFTWLSGDHICEQHIHNLDVCNWVMKKHPTKAISLGGRQVRTDAAYGHVFDHFATEYEYDNGVKMISMCRQIDGTAARVSEQIVGTQGKSNPSQGIYGIKRHSYEGERPNPYVEEHKNLIRSIRGGDPLNEGIQVAESTLTAIMGRMAAYTGGEVTWEQALNSKEVLVPEKLEFGALPVANVAVPGKTRLV